MSACSAGPGAAHELEGTVLHNTSCTSMSQPQPGACLHTSPPARLRCSSYSTALVTVTRYAMDRCLLHVLSLQLRCTILANALNHQPTSSLATLTTATAQLEHNSDACFQRYKVLGAEGPYPHPALLFGEPALCSAGTQLF